MIEDRTEALIRTALERDASEVELVSPEWSDTVRLRQREAPDKRRPVLAVAAVALAVLTVGAVVIRAADSQDGDVAGVPSPLSTPASTIDDVVAPPSTLPPAANDGVPMTVASQPPSYVRLADDLDVGWVDTGSDPQFCWRTPAQESCVPDPRDPGAAERPTIVVPSSPGFALVIVVDDRSPRASSVTVSAAGGSRSTAPVESAADVALGYARFAIDAAELTVVEVN